MAGDQEPSVARWEHRRQHLDRRRLAGAVGAEKAENDARLNRERDMVDCGEVIEALDQIAGLNDRGHHFYRQFPSAVPVPVIRFGVVFMVTLSRPKNRY